VGGSARAAGGALRIWPVFVLGRRFSGLAAIQPGHTLVTTGVYGGIRHPSYLGLLVSSLGWGLASRSAIGVALAALILVPLVARIRATATSGTGARIRRPSRTWRGSFPASRRRSSST
jgi:protein-S-isoprenylcysteine O-methyltransferase Ste14